MYMCTYQHIWVYTYDMCVVLLRSNANCTGSETLYHTGAFQTRVANLPQACVNVLLIVLKPLRLSKNNRRAPEVCTLSNRS